MELNLAFGVAASLTLIAGFYPYIRDIFRRQTKPHIYTWLIWSITQGTALLALVYGNGGLFAGVGIASGAFLTFVVFLLSFKFGTKNITVIDTVTLVGALAAVVVWWQLDSPLVAVLMVAFIDGIGYVPTYRKSWSEPRTETLSFWLLFTAGNLFALLAVAEYNLLTTSYLVTVVTASVLLIILCIYRRGVVPDAASL
ncbi:MAG TPA: hypothetical protein VF696_00825 [Candidatus Paceibacterota bacterium]